MFQELQRSLKREKREAVPGGRSWRTEKRIFERKAQKKERGRKEENKIEYRRQDGTVDVDDDARDAKMRRQQQGTNYAQNSRPPLYLTPSFLLFFHEFKFNFRVPFLAFALVPFPNTSSFFPHTTITQPPTFPSPSQPLFFQPSSPSTHHMYSYLPTILPCHILYGEGLLPFLHGEQYQENEIYKDEEKKH